MLYTYVHTYNDTPRLILISINYLMGKQRQKNQDKVNADLSLPSAPAPDLNSSDNYLESSDSSIDLPARKRRRVTNHVPHISRGGCAVMAPSPDLSSTTDDGTDSDVAIGLEMEKVMEEQRSEDESDGDWFNDDEGSEKAGHSTDYEEDFCCDP